MDDDARAEVQAWAAARVTPPVADPAAAANGAACKTCGARYDLNDADARRHHTAPADCQGCGRCRDRPACYACTGSFCVCGTH